jgi:hypothetical protein
MELAFTLPSSAFAGGPIDVNISVHGDVPDQTIRILHLASACDPTTCMDQGVDTMSVTGMEDGDAIILESEPAYPPIDLSVTVTCP